MKAHIELPSGEITEVEFEYVKIEKHCFTCFSLLHEEEDCPKRAPGDPPAKERKLGITQAMALERIEAGKRRHDENRGYKPPSQRALPVYNERKGSMDYARRPPSSNSHRSEGQRDVPSYRPRRSDDITNRYGLTVSGSYNSHHQRPPRDTPVKYGPSPLDGRSGNDQVRPNASASSHTPPPVPIRERMEPPAGNSSPLESCKSRERRSALLRLAAPDLRDQLPRRSPISKQSGRLQDVEIISGDTPIQARRDATNEIRGTCFSRTDTPAVHEPTAPASTKRRTTRNTANKRIARSPLPGFKLKKVNALKPNPPPRKRICTEKGRSLPWNKAGPSTSGGLALIWTDNIKVEILESSENIIDTKVAFKGSSSFISFIYGAPSVENRAAVWAEISRIGTNRDLPWLLTGDFNEILDNTEKVGGPPRWEGSFTTFRTFVSQNGFWDL
ncbi:unnamed protein product, partial [Brassica rapa subsp. narinosa]